MSITRLTLAAALQSIGVAQVFVGNALVASGLSALGPTEGAIGFEAAYEDNPLTAPEYTGGIIHDTVVFGGQATVTVPLIMGDSAVYAKIDPFGVGTGGGYVGPRAPVTTSVLIVPLRELDPTTGELAYDGTTWTPGAPVHAVLIWKAYVMPERTDFAFANGGKQIRSVTFRSMYAAASANGHKVWSRGGAGMVAGNAAVRI
jgi:hypothetical protein